MSNVSFADLGLAEPLLRALDAAKYTVPTPIQARTIPALLVSVVLQAMAVTALLSGIFDSFNWAAK